MYEDKLEEHNPDTNKAELIQSGDVETHPGPKSTENTIGASVLLEINQELNLSDPNFIRNPQLD